MAYFAFIKILSANIDQHCPLVAHITHNLKIYKSIKHLNI